MSGPLNDLNADIFTVPDAWSGGHYEIAVELGERSDERAVTALERLWSYNALEGCYLFTDREPATQQRVEVREHLEDTLYGVATLPNRQRAPCASVLCRFDNGSDWAMFYMPLAPLGKTYPVGGFPFVEDKETVAWRAELDAWLKRIAKYVFQGFPFRLALIGFEVEIANVSSEAVHVAGIPKRRFEGFLWRVNDQLLWYPPTG